MQKFPSIEQFRHVVRAVRDQASFDGVRHAYQFLKPGGTLVAVMSARAEFGTDARHQALHKLIDSTKTRWAGRDWSDLPEKSFAHAGTNVNTSILTIRKPRT